MTQAPRLSLFQNSMPVSSMAQKSMVFRKYVASVLGFLFRMMGQVIQLQASVALALDVIQLLTQNKFSMGKRQAKVKIWSITFLRSLRNEMEAIIKEYAI